MEIYAKHLENVNEDFKARFEDLQKMHVSDWIVAPFDFNAKMQTVICNFKMNSLLHVWTSKLNHCSNATTCECVTVGAT